MRLFIAIELNSEMRSEASALLNKLVKSGINGRFVDENNLHITLHFIGESDDLNGAVLAMREAVRDIHPFTLRPAGCGQFVRGDGATPYITVGGELSEMNILHESLESALADNGFSREYKKFVPHITLGRNVEMTEEYKKIMDSACFDSSSLISSITLFESTRVRGRMVYTPLHREKF